MLIEDLSSSGEGVGSIDGKKVFVDGALPGEEVEVEIFEDKKRYARAKLIRLSKASPARRDPVCPLFGTCGGCQLMHLSYEEQLKWKRKKVQEALKRIGGLDVEVSMCIPSPDQLGYRNKIHLHRGGLNKRHSHEIVPIDYCYILDPEGNKQLPVVGETIIRAPIQTLGHLKFKIGANDFFQVNSKQALQLYQKAISCAKPKGKVLDAYCGVGCLALFAAGCAEHVLGIEIVQSSVKSAEENAKLNGIANVSFRCGRVENLLPKLGSFDTIFLNPPRGGVEPAVIAALRKHPPKKLIYISCDPATLARDLKALEFKINEVVPFDMFPQTIHIETLVSLSL